jgi:hypothetical protein
MVPESRKAVALVDGSQREQPRRPGSLQRRLPFLVRRPTTVFTALSVTPLPIGSPLVESGHVAHTVVVVLDVDEVLGTQREGPGRAQRERARPVVVRRAPAGEQPRRRASSGEQPYSVFRYSMMARRSASVRTLVYSWPWLPLLKALVL